MPPKTTTKITKTIIKTVNTSKKNSNGGKSITTKTNTNTKRFKI